MSTGLELSRREPGSKLAAKQCKWSGAQSLLPALVLYGDVGIPTGCFKACFSLEADMLVCVCVSCELVQRAEEWGSWEPTKFPCINKIAFS